MNEVAEGVWQIPLMPRHGVNAWLMGDVLVDAGYSFNAKKLLGELSGRNVTAHALTHAHWDHAGSSGRIRRELGVPCWVGEADAEAARTGRMVTRDNPVAGFAAKIMKFPPTEIDRVLSEDDEVAGFRVLHVPGHSPGHVAYWRESDRTLVGGDVFFNLNLLTLAPGLRPPPKPFTPDPAQNRESMRRLADLEPAVACFGHGPPVTDAAPKLRACVERLK